MLLIFTFPDRNCLRLLYDYCSHLWSNRVKGALSSLRQFLAIGSPLEMKKNALYFTSKALLRYGKTRVMSWKLKSTSWNSKVRARIKSTSYKFESMSYQFESTSSRIIKNSMKTQVNTPKIISSKLFGNSWGFWW